MNSLANFLLAGMLCTAVPAAADVISVQPSSKTVNAGDVFSLDIDITGATDLAAFQFHVGFDPFIMAAVSVTEGAFFAGPDSLFFAGTIDNVGGTVTYIADLLTSPSGVSGNGTLATVTFSALAQGSGSVDVFDATLLNSFGEGIGSTTAGAAVTVAGVPEPSAAVLLGTAMLGIAGVCRRLRRY